MGFRQQFMDVISDVLTFGKVTGSRMGALKSSAATPGLVYWS